ncbi:MAG: DUF1573 domain-containing protein [Bacteroidia bacterium]|nr:DUF1573 domain-containing protein [Bacteroidia bacterium]
MDSKKIIIGLLALVAILLGLNLAGIFDKGDQSLRDKARQSLAPTEAATTTSTTTPSTPAVPAGPTTVMAFEETEFDFGTVEMGDKVEHIYSFTNTGDEPLVISNATGSCGCTVPQWPKEPIAPGATGEILVSFDTKNKPNNQTKRVTITANTEPAQSFLTIKGFVEGSTETPATTIQTQ